MSPALRKRASWWLVRLQGDEVSEAERIAFGQWLDADPRHREAFTQVASAVGEVAALKHELARLEGAARPIAVERHPRTSFAFAGAALAACALIGVVWVGEAGKRRIETRIGEQRAIVLNDGSHVELNTDTAIEVRLHAGAREVRLVRGEALFEVKPESRPFEVEAGGRRVRALGTAFVVRIEGEALNVLVTEGVVGVSAARRERAPSDPNAGLRLFAGQRLQASPANVSVRQLSSEEVMRRLAWREGMLRFEGEPLGEVVREVARYNGVSFTISDPELETLSVIAYIRANNLAGFLELLEENFPELEARRSGRSVVISRRTEPA